MFIVTVYSFFQTMFPHIVVDSEVMRWQPTVKWTRLTVQFLMDEISQYGTEYVIDNYPSITEDIIKEIFRYCAAYLHSSEEVYA